MTIVSRGYDQPNVDSVSNTEYAQMQFGLGRNYWIYDPSHARVTARNGGVTVSTGILGGLGILDNITVAENVNLASSGQSQWWLICLRRQFGGTQASSLVAVAGDISTNVPTTMPNTRQVINLLAANPGSTDDQPLAYVLMPANVATPSQIINLGVYGSAPQSQYILHTLAQQIYANLGWTGYLGTTQYRRRLNVNGTTIEWVKSGPTIRQALTRATGAQVAAPATNYTLQMAAGVQDGNRYQVDFQVIRSGASLPTTNNQGHVADHAVADLTDAWSEAGGYVSPVRGYMYQGGNGGPSFGVDFRIGSDGVITLYAGTPYVDITKGTVLGGRYSFIRTDATT